MTEEFSSLRFTRDFFESFADRRFTAQDRARLLKCLERLDTDERHRSLRIHALSGDMAGFWAASASQSLRLTFERRADGIKLLHSCTKHYDR